MEKRIGKEFFAKKASLVAPKMIGLKLCTPSCSAVLCEVEAYEGKNDAASHAHTKTPRSAIMHETYAHWYVYFIYGNHHCLNITCGKNEAGAVLVREAIPINGIPLMRKRRKMLKIKKLKHKRGGSDFLNGEKYLGDERKGLCDGPGKLCQAFGIDKKYNGLKLGEKLWLEKINPREKTMLKKHLKHNKQFAKSKKIVIKHNKTLGGGGKNNFKGKKPAREVLLEKKLMKKSSSNIRLGVASLPRIGISKAKKKKWRFKLLLG